LVDDKPDNAGLVPDVPDSLVTSVQLARILRMSVSRVEALAAQGTFVRFKTGQFLLAASVGPYVEKLRTVASGRETPVSKSKERLAEAQAAIAEHKQQMLRGEFIPVAEHERRLTDVCRYLRGGILALPSRIAGHLPHMTKSEVALMDAEVRDVLSQLAHGQDVVPPNG
jgi:phage terminase Nu1 subunit (DNA packaging protein)